MAPRSKKVSTAEQQIEIVNDKQIDEFITNYVPEPSSWTRWVSPKTSKIYDIALLPMHEMGNSNLDACYELIKETSSADYKSSSLGWKPKTKKKEMRSDDLKYIFVREQGKGDILGFISFMPTIEDDLPVVYVYEIHLKLELQGIGIGHFLMQLVEDISEKIPVVQKVMLSCFVKNKRAVEFYNKRGYSLDEFSPPARKLRTGVVIEPDYIAMSKTTGH